MAAYARGCAAAQVDNLRDEYGPARPRYKKGDRVRTKGYEGTHWGGEGVIVRVGGYCNIVEIDGDRGGFFDHELEPVTLQLEAGKYYRTRDGRKVGPMFKRGIDGFPWEGDGTFQFYTVGGRADDGDEYDIIAEWVDEPKSTKEILDDLEAWMAEQDASRDNTPTDTTGFTVPLCAYDDEPGWYVAELGRAYADGYAAGLRASQEQAA